MPNVDILLGLLVAMVVLVTMAHLRTHYEDRCRLFTARYHDEASEPDEEYTAAYQSLQRALLRAATPTCAAAASRLQDRIPRIGIESSERLGRVRWVAERTMAWFTDFRRLDVRYERGDDIHLAFLHLGCALICLRAVERYRTA